MSDAKPQVHWVTIDEGAHEQRLDNFLLCHFKTCPKSLIYKIIRTGQVRVNKKRAEAKTRLATGDIIRIPPVKVESSSDKPILLKDEFKQEIAAAILHEDDAIMVINKPAQWAVHGGSNLHFGLIEALKTMYGPSMELAHRLDKETSGCLLIAKTKSALRQLHQQFRADQINKVYDLWVHGRWPKRLNKIQAPLKKVHHLKGGWQVYVNPEGKPSLTTFEAIRTHEQWSHVRARLKTGRTHQIRVHSLHAGHPILGDPKYASTQIHQTYANILNLKRMALHARELSFTHPSNSKLFKIEAPLDDDLINLRNQLEQL